jgi:hypothetical protein
MSKSDRVLGTPPTNTPETPDTPFAGLAAAVAPQWGETILRLTEATDRLANRFDQFIGADKKADTVKACRQLAAELINFLDSLEDTDQDAAVDDGPCDTDELELAEDDDEPSLGSTGHGSGGPISYGIPVVHAGGEVIHDCEGDEHDGREPQEDDEPDDTGIGDLDGLKEVVGSEYCIVGEFV